MASLSEGRRQRFCDDDSAMGLPNEWPPSKSEPLRAKPGAYQDAKLSPDGKRVALSVSEGGDSCGSRSSARPSSLAPGRGIWRRTASAWRS